METDAATPLTSNPTYSNKTSYNIPTESPNWVPLIAALSASALFLIIVGAIAMICFKLRRSENVADGKT
jgi:hypothetical protein